MPRRSGRLILLAWALGGPAWGQPVVTETDVTAEIKKLDRTFGDLPVQLTVGTLRSETPYLDVRCLKQDAGDDDVAELRKKLAGVRVPIHLRLPPGPKVTDRSIAALKGWPQLEGLSAEGTAVTDAGLADLVGLPGLRQFVAGGEKTRVTADGVRRLAERTQLRSLSLVLDALTDDDLRPLAALTELRDLGLVCKNLTEKGLAHLEGLTRLERLYYPGDRTDAGLSHLTRMTRLRDLRLFGDGVTDAGMASVGKLTGLRTLSLLNTRVTAAGLAHLDGLTDLEQLSLYGVRDAGGRALAPLKGMTKLRDLDTNAVLLPEGAGFVAGAAALERLEVGGVRGDALKALRDLAKLRQLTVRRDGLTDATLAPLAEFKALRRLVLGGDLFVTDVTDAGLAHLAGLTTLEHVVIEKAKVTDAGLAHLKNLTRLRSLSLRENPVTDEGIKHLHALPDLSSLNLGETKVTPAGVEAFKKARPGISILGGPR